MQVLDGEKAAEALPERLGGERSGGMPMVTEMGSSSGGQGGRQAVRSHC